MARTIDEARQALASRLRDLRKNARLSGRDLAPAGGLPTDGNVR